MTSPPSIGDYVIMGVITARVVSAGLDVACVAVSRPDFHRDVHGGDYYELYWVGLDEIEPALLAR